MRAGYLHDDGGMHELFADELPSSLEDLSVELLPAEYAPLASSTVSTLTTVGSVSCPSTAGTLSTVSSIKP
jgi:hypothetical protein